MPNILFLIGNGFDLNIGLKTRFSDVKSEYLSLVSNDPLINDFKKILSLDHENWSDFEKAMGVYTERFIQFNKDIYISQINSFKEVLIEKFNTEQSRIEYLSNKEHITNTFRDSLTNIFNYFNNKSKQKIKSIIEASRQNNEFTYNFINFNYTNVLEKCIETLQTNNNNFNFRTYNYQGSVFPIVDKVESILHIHGTLQENLILGVDNIEQIKSEELKQDNEFQWEIVKPRINEALEENYDLNARVLILSSSIICIFGMSIGDTDKTWWEKIYEWLKSSDERHLLIFYYNKNGVNEKNPSAKIKHTFYVKDLFFNTVGISDKQEMEKCYNRIHIAIKNESIFKLDIISKVK